MDAIKDYAWDEGHADGYGIGHAEGHADGYNAAKAEDDEVLKGQAAALSEKDAALKAKDAEIAGL